MPAVNFFVPMKVVGKGRPRFSRRSMTAYTPRQTVVAERAIREQAELAMRHSGLLRAPEGVPVSVMLTAYLPIAKSATKKKKAAVERGEVPCLKKPDIDNILKLMDGLNGIVFEDDKQVVSANVFKLYNHEVEGLHFSIRWSEEEPEAVAGFMKNINEMEVNR